MLEKIEPMEFIEDDEIIRLFHERKREQEAFRLLVNKYKERLYWHIRKIVIATIRNYIPGCTGLQPTNR